MRKRALAWLAAAGLAVAVLGGCARCDEQKGLSTTFCLDT